MSFETRIKSRQCCDKCQSLLSEDDFYFDPPWDRKCKHGVLLKMHMKFACPACRYNSTWYTLCADEDEHCQKCTALKEDRDDKMTNKPRPESYIGRNLEFYVLNDDCRGHWMLEELGDDGFCTDCNQNECYPYGVYHCCCEA